MLKCKSWHKSKSKNWYISMFASCGQEPLGRPTAFFFFLGHKVKKPEEKIVGKNLKLLKLKVTRGK